MAVPLVDLRPGRLDVRHTRGDAAAFQVTINEGGEPADITGRTYKAQIRRKPAAVVAAEITVTVTDAGEGVLVVSLDEDVSRSLSGIYTWDFEQTASGQRRTLLYGEWIVDDDVTRVGY